MTPPESRDEEGAPPVDAAFSRYEAVFEAAPDGILIVDDEGVIRDANPRAATLFGYPREELVGTLVEHLVPPEHRGGHERDREDYMDAPRPRPMGIGLELNAYRKDGHLVPVEISLSPFQSPEGTWVVAVVRDVSEHRRLRRFGLGSLRAAEEERRRIAQELHDDTAQCLSALLVRLTLLRRSDDPARRSELLDEMREELDEAVEGVRRISRGLRPPALDDLGVEAALRAHIRGFLAPSPLEVEVELEPLADRLGRDAQLVIYRVAQEALSNVVRHADASAVRVTLSEADGEARLEVVDDGVGVDLEEELFQGAGLGLVGMDERARQVGGRLELTSALGAGTRVTLCVPFSAGVDPDGVAEVAGAEGGSDG